MSVEASEKRLFRKSMTEVILPNDCREINIDCRRISEIANFTKRKSWTSVSNRRAPDFASIISEGRMLLTENDSTEKEAKKTFLGHGPESKKNNSKYLKNVAK